MVEKKEIEKVIEELAKIGRELEDEKERLIKEKIEKTKKSISAMYDPILKKLENAIKEIVDSGDIRKITEICCYKNLGFCCGVERECPLRDIALTVLEIDKEEYKRLKEEFGKLLATKEGRKKLREFFDSVNLKV